MPRFDGACAEGSHEMISRRGLITGLIAFGAAPAIVRYHSLMPIKPIEPALPLFDFDGIKLFVGDTIKISYEIKDGIWRVLNHTILKSTEQLQDTNFFKRVPIITKEVK
jgi:hypothetical protein